MLRGVDCPLVLFCATTGQVNIRRPRLGRQNLGSVLVQPGDDCRSHAAFRVASLLPLQVNVVALHSFVGLLLCRA